MWSFRYLDYWTTFTAVGVLVFSMIIWVVQAFRQSLPSHTSGDVEDQALISLLSHTSKDVADQASQLLTIWPSGELKLLFKSKKERTCSFLLHNSTNSIVAFKVMVTDPKKYYMQPKNGLVWPHSSVSVTATRQAQSEPPPYVLGKDKFMVKSVIARFGEFSPDLFDEASGNLNLKIHSAKLGVVYLA